VLNEQELENLLHANNSPGEEFPIENLLLKNKTGNSTQKNFESLKAPNFTSNLHQNIEDEI